MIFPKTRSIFFIFFVVKLHALDYLKIAREIEKTNKDPQIKKIAVLPFEDINYRESRRGLEIQEELTYAFVRHSHFQLVERSQVNKILEELQFQQTGVVDERSAKQIGKGLGVDGLVTGSIKTEGGETKLYARLIRVEDFAIVAVASDISRVTKETPYDKKASYETSYGPQVEIDLWGTLGLTQMSLSFGKPTGDYPLVNASHLGLLGLSGNYRTVDMNRLQERQSLPPLGLRLRFHSKTQGFYFSPGLFELMWQRSYLKAQEGQIIFNQAQEVSTYLPERYMDFSSLDFTIPLLLGFEHTTWRLYSGVGLGFVLGFFSSAYILSYNYASQTFEKTSNQVGSGFQGSLFLGTMYHLNSFLSIMLETRYFGAFAEFNRDGETTGFLISEDMTVYRRGFLFLGGLTFRL
ncbi:MAG: CsgG/HfaB family protein [Leptospiraceae bacterium]|nr:CsgG/HfaB family protein [Leptospiraceae bacterium]MDW8306284.1 FlgO family outer membrane protein [Leptospiraceae bacterium]